MDSKEFAELRERVMALHAEGKSYAAIGRELDVSRQRVRQIVTYRSTGNPRGRKPGAVCPNCKGTGRLAES